MQRHARLITLVVGVGCLALLAVHTTRPTVLLGSGRTQSLVNLQRGLTADEKIAADTLAVLKAEEKLHHNLGELAIKDLDATAVSKLHTVNKQLKVAAAQHPQPHPAAAKKKVVVHLSKADMSKIVRETVARLKAELNVAHPPSPQQLRAVHAPVVQHPHPAARFHIATHAHLLADAEEPAAEGDAAAAPAQNKTSDEEVDPEEADLPQANFRELPVKMSENTLKFLSNTEPGTRTQMAEGGDPDEEVGVEDPDLQAPEEQDRAYAKIMPKWAKEGFKGDPFFENGDHFGKYDPQKPRWKKLLYGEMHPLMRNKFGYPRDKWVPLRLAHIQMYPHSDPTDIDRFPKLKDREQDKEEEKKLDPADAKHIDLFKDERGVREKNLVNGVLDKYGYTSRWKPSNRFTFTDRRIKVDPDDLQRLERFSSAGDGYVSQ